MTTKIMLIGLTVYQRAALAIMLAKSSINLIDEEHQEVAIEESVALSEDVWNELEKASRSKSMDIYGGGVNADKAFGIGMIRAQKAKAHYQRQAEKWQRQGNAKGERPK